MYLNKLDPRDIEMVLETLSQDSNIDEEFSFGAEQEGSGVRVAIGWHRYIGIEHRDNSIEDFKNWATEASSVLDWAEGIVRSLEKSMEP